MAVEVLMEGLWVLVVAGEGVGAVESASGGVVISGAEIIPLQRIVPHFAGVQQFRLRLYRTKQIAIGIIIIGFADRAIRLCQLTYGAMSIVLSNAKQGLFIF